MHFGQIKSILRDRFARIFDCIKLHKKRFSSTVFYIYLRNFVRNSGQSYRTAQALR